jgi:hypothetical protein
MRRLRDFPYVLGLRALPATDACSTAAAKGSCGSCRHFCNNTAYLEAAIPGLAGLSSGAASMRADDGLCQLHDRYPSARACCANFASAQSANPTAAPTFDCERQLIEHFCPIVAATPASLNTLRGLDLSQGTIWLSAHLTRLDLCTNELHARRHWKMMRSRSSTQRRAFADNSTDDRCEQIRRGLQCEQGRRLNPAVCNKCSGWDADRRRDLGPNNSLNLQNNRESRNTGLNRWPSGECRWIASLSIAMRTGAVSIQW